jgi:hypothetical protein
LTPLFPEFGIPDYRKCDEQIFVQPSVTPTPALREFARRSNAATDGYVLAVILIKMVIGGGVGYLIGRSKDRPWAGFWWGTCIGWIGWLITGCLRKREALA